MGRHFLGVWHGFLVLRTVARFNGEPDTTSHPLEGVAMLLALDLLLLALLFVTLLLFLFALAEITFAIYGWLCARSSSGIVVWTCLFAWSAAFGAILYTTTGTLMFVGGLIGMAVQEKLAEA
jgi:hypothetical protein